MCRLIGNYQCSCKRAVFSQGWRISQLEKSFLGPIYRFRETGGEWTEGDDIVRVCVCGNRLEHGRTGLYGYWELCPQTRKEWEDGQDGRDREGGSEVA